MKSLEPFKPLFTAIIAFSAVFTALGLMFNILLKPVKIEIHRLDGEIKEVRADIQAMNEKFDEKFNNLILILSKDKQVQVTK